MEISLTILQELNEIFSKDFEFYEGAKLDFFSHFADMLSILQQTENRVFQEKDIKAVFCFYKILLIARPQFLNCEMLPSFQTIQVNINVITQDFLDNFTTPIEIHPQQSEELSLIKTKFELNVDQLEIVYENKGSLDFFYSIYLFHSKIQLPMIYSRTLVDQAKSFFEEKFFSVETKLERIDEMFLSFVNQENDVLLNFLNDYFYFLFVPKYKSIKEKIESYLFLSLNLLQEDKLMIVSNLLCQLITRNKYFSNEFLIRKFSKNNLHKNDIDSQLQKFSNQNVLIYFRERSNDSRFSFYTEIHQVNKKILQHLKKIRSPYIQLVFLDQNMNKIGQHTIKRTTHLNKYFYKINEEDCKSEQLQTYTEKKDKPALILDLFFKMNLNSQEKNSLINNLNEEGFNLYIDINFKEIQKKKNYFHFAEKIPKEKNPLLNHVLLQHITKSLAYWLDHLSLKGIFLSNFSDCFIFTRLPKQIYQSMEDIIHNLKYVQETSLVTYENLFSDVIHINPLLVQLQQTMYQIIPSIDIISSEKPSLMTLYSSFYLKNLFLMTNCSQEAIQCEFASQISSYPINMPILCQYDFINKSNSNYQNFLKLITNDFQVSLIMPKWETFKRSSQQLFQPIITDQFMGIKYIPIISENCHNFIHSYILIQNEMIFFITKNIAFHEMLIKFNFSELFIYLEEFYPDYISIIDKQNRIYHYKDFFSSLIELKMDTDSFVECFQLSKIPPTHQKTQINDKYNYFYNLEIFLQEQISRETIDEKTLTDFLHLLIIIGVQNQDQMQLLKQCSQISSNLIYYNYFMLLIQALNESGLVKDQQLNLSQFIEVNKLKSIAVLTPEYGRFIMTGGLAIVVENIVSLISKKGVNFTVIIPYYNLNNDNISNYLQDQNVKHIFNLKLEFHGVIYEFGVHNLNEDNISFYFIHNFYLFPKIYSYENDEHQIKSLSLFNYVALYLLKKLEQKPQIILTNDWFCGLAGAYHKSNLFQDYFNQSKFIHVFHNMGDEYQGRIYLHNFKGDLQYLTGLNCNLTINPNWESAILNPSRCALLCSDQWFTVSKSYKNQCLKQSSLKDLLNMYEKPFACSNGIHDKLISQKFEQIGNHEEEKWKILSNIFKYTDDQKEEVLNSRILLGYIGRICAQKGIHLICNSFEQLYTITNGNICFILTGQQDFSEYSQEQIRNMDLLREKYPNNFQFQQVKNFEINLQIARGSDFIVIPSVYQPGGIVQHNSLLAGTPVIAFKTGGLQDTIQQFDSKTLKGNGFLFMSHEQTVFIQTIQQAISVYQQQNLYQQLRKNASESYVRIEDQAMAWYGEFCRQLDGKILPVNNFSLKQLNQRLVKMKSQKLFIRDFYREYSRVYFQWSKDQWCNNYMMDYDDISGMWVYEKPYSNYEEQIRFYGDDELIIQTNYGLRFSKDGNLNNFV